MKSKNIYLVVAVSLLLITGLYINFILQKDFLTQIGFDGTLAIICIIFFDASKIISEILFFKLKKVLPKVIIGTFAFLLVFLSIYTTFSVRIWKSRMTSQHTDDINSDLRQKNKQIEETKNRIARQLKSLEEQIKTKRSTIKNLNRRDKNKWLTYQYNKGINKLNEQKLVLLKEIENIETKRINISNKKLSLKAAMEDSFGSNGENLEKIINLVIALVTDGIIVFLCFSLSFVLGQKEMLNMLTLEKGPPIDIKSTQQESNDKSRSFYDDNFEFSNSENIMFYNESDEDRDKTTEKKLSKS